VAPIESSRTCPSCGATGAGSYCDRCGEKRRNNHDFSIRHFLSEAVETFTHFDSKILRTAWRLVAHPGALSADYLDGRRIRYVNPLRLFLLAPTALTVLVTPLWPAYGEALAAGLPVVGWRAGNLPHLVSDGVEGVVFDGAICRPSPSHSTGWPATSCGGPTSRGRRAAEALRCRDGATAATLFAALKELTASAR